MPRWSILMFALAATTPFPGSAATTPPSDATRISYRSPQEALDALRAKPGTTLRQENDWWVIRDPEDHAIWSITLPAHPAHPTAVKRTPYILSLIHISNPTPWNSLIRKAPPGRR